MIEKILSECEFIVELKKGDCLELMKDIPDGSVDMILCDLPYGTTACKWDNVIPFEPLWEQYKRVIKKNGAIVLFGTEPFSSLLRVSNLKDYKYDWVWDKVTARGHLVAKKRPMQQTENILVFNCNYKSYHPIMTNRKYPRKDINVEYSRSEICGGTITKEKKNIVRDKKYPKNILVFSNASQKNKFHPAQKPVLLLEYLIRTYTIEGETVLDNCMGSGSTGVACVNTGRNFIGIELDEHYFEIAKNRIESSEKQNGEKQL